MNLTKVAISIPDLYQRWGASGYKEIDGLEIEEEDKGDLGVYIPVGFTHDDGTKDWGQIVVRVDSESEELTIEAHGSEVSVREQSTKESDLL